MLSRGRLQVERKPTLRDRVGNVKVALIQGQEAQTQAQSCPPEWLHG